MTINYFTLSDVPLLDKNVIPIIGMQITFLIYKMNFIGFHFNAACKTVCPYL